MYSFTLNFELPAIQSLLLGLSLLLTLVALTVFMLKVRPVTRCRARCDKAATEPAPMACVGASIIVYSVDEQDSLARLLPQLLGQDYDGEFEVIVVNEGDSVGVRDVVETLQTTHRNLYLTHTPDGARNLSRKKLALTLGIKAARYPVAVLTGATAILPGNRWLRAMMSHFSDSNHTGVVLGYACADPYEDTAVGARTRSFDFVADSVMWISDALKGRPWRGTEYNLAYRRELFFRSKGFSSNLNLRYGDDDIFVSRIATDANTAVELAEESIVEVPGAATRRASRERAARRRFTERFITRRPRLLATIGWWSYALALLCALAVAAFPPFSLFTALAEAACLVVWFITGLTWRGAMTALRGRRLFLTLPFMAFSRPFRMILRTFYAQTHRGKRYTWE